MIVKEAFDVIVLLLAGVDPSVPVLKKGEDLWKISKKLMSDKNQFTDKLYSLKVALENGKIPKRNLDAVKSIITREDFTVERMNKVSKAGASLVSWILEHVHC